MSIPFSTCYRFVAASRPEGALQAGDRAVSVQECLDAEQSDRETMKQEWSTFSASDRKHCIAEATMGGEFELYRTCHMSRNGAGRQEAENGAGGFKADRLMDENCATC